MRHSCFLLWFSPSIGRQAKHCDCLSRCLDFARKKKKKKKKKKKRKERSRPGQPAEMDDKTIYNGLPFFQTSLYASELRNKKKETHVGVMLSSNFYHQRLQGKLIAICTVFDEVGCLIFVSSPPEICTPALTDTVILQIFGVCGCCRDRSMYFSHLGVGKTIDHRKYRT